MNSRIVKHVLNRRITYRFMEHDPIGISDVLEAELQRYRKSILLVNFSAHPYWHETLASLKHNIFPFTWNATKRQKSETIQRFSVADSGIFLTTLRSLESGVQVDANAVFILDVKFSQVNPEPMYVRLRDVYTRSSARSIAVYYFVSDLMLDFRAGKFIRMLRAKESERHHQQVDNSSKLPDAMIRRRLSVQDKLADLRVNINTAYQTVGYRFMVHQPGQIAPTLSGILQQYKKSIVVYNGKAELYWQKTFRHLNRDVFVMNDNSSDSRVTQRFSKATKGILLTTLSCLETAPKLGADAIFVLHLNFRNSQSKELPLKLRNIYLQSSAIDVAVYFFFPDAPLDFSCESFIDGFRNYLPSQSHENASTTMEAEPPILRSSQKKETRIHREQKKRRPGRSLSPKPVFDRISGLWKSSKAIVEQQPIVRDESSMLPIAKQNNVNRTEKSKMALRTAKPRPTFQSPIPIEVPLGDTPTPIANRSQECNRVIAVMQLRPS